MRRTVTWVAVGALCALAAVAALDALRADSPEREPAAPGERPPPADPALSLQPGHFLAMADREPPPGTLSERSFAAGSLHSAGLSGWLYLSDERCRLRGYQLPSLQVQAMPDVRACSFSISEDGWLALEQAVWQPAGSFAAVARDGWIDIVTRVGEEYERFRGSAPSWSPDGGLLYVFNGDAHRWPGDALVLSGYDLARALRRDVGPAAGAAIEQAARLPDGDIAVVASLGRPRGYGPPEAVLAIYEPHHPRAALLSRAQEISDLTPSPGGRHLAVRVGPMLHILGVGGRVRESKVDLASADLRSFAWSPDGRWLVVASGTQLSFVPAAHPGSGRRPILGPIVARDLAWR
jgi:hypothetical protein